MNNAHRNNTVPCHEAPPWRHFCGAHMWRFRCLRCGVWSVAGSDWHCWTQRLSFSSTHLSHDSVSPPPPPPPHMITCPQNEVSSISVMLGKPTQTISPRVRTCMCVCTRRCARMHVHMHACTCTRCTCTEIYERLIEHLLSPVSAFRGILVLSAY